MLEEGRLGGMSWGMGRGAAPPSVDPDRAVLTLSRAAIGGLADADAAVVGRDPLVHEDVAARRRASCVLDDSVSRAFWNTPPVSATVSMPCVPASSIGDVGGRARPIVSWNAAASTGAGVPASRSATSARNERRGIEHDMPSSARSRPPCRR